MLKHTLLISFIFLLSLGCICEPLTVQSVEYSAREKITGIAVQRNFNVLEVLVSSEHHKYILNEQVVDNNLPRLRVNDTAFIFYVEDEGVRYIKFFTILEIGEPAAQKCHCPAQFPCLL